MLIKFNFLDSTAFRNEHKYRVLCKNGTLAMNTGFDVGEECAWSVTIDSEVNIFHSWRYFLPIINN